MKGNNSKAEKGGGLDNAKKEKHHVVVKHKRPTRYGNYEGKSDVIGYKNALREAAYILSSCKARNLEPTKVLIDGKEVDPNQLPPVKSII